MQKDTTGQFVAAVQLTYFCWRSLVMEETFPRKRCPWRSAEAPLGRDLAPVIAAPLRKKRHTSGRAHETRNFPFNARPKQGELAHRAGATSLNYNHRRGCAVSFLTDNQRSRQHKNCLLDHCCLFSNSAQR